MAKAMTKAQIVAKLGGDFDENLAELAREQTAAERLAWERHLLGMPVSVHPLETIRVDEARMPLLDVTDLTDQHLTAKVGGETIDPERHEIYTEIKAVTYHGLRIEQKGSRWYAEILFDV